MTWVLLVFGGEGSEHDVSVMSARNVVEALNNADYEVILAYITRTGDWLAAHTIDDITAQPISIDRIDIDVIFPLIHGKGGEDGMIAKMGQISNIPVVGCGPEASAIAWDKDRCKQTLQAAGLAVVPWLTVNEGESITYETARQKLDSDTLFIKPAREGSSIGVSKVTSEQEFAKALEEAFYRDDKILIEKAIVGRELECAILGNLPDIQATDVGEVRANADFYDYSAKYTADSAAATDIPALGLSNDIRQEIQDSAKKAYVAIGGSGLSRIDFFLATDGTIYINEINTMPGFTNISMYPKLWQHSGISYSDLASRLIKLAVDGYTSNKIS